MWGRWLGLFRCVIPGSSCMWKMRGLCLFSLSDGRLWDRGVFAAAAGSGKPPISKVPLPDHREDGQEHQYTDTQSQSCQGHAHREGVTADAQLGVARPHFCARRETGRTIRPRLDFSLDLTQTQGCRSGAMAQKIAPRENSRRKGLFLRRQMMASVV